MSAFTEKGIEELLKLRDEKREALRVFRFEMAGSKIKNVKIGKMLRKEIARIETELSFRKRQGRTGAALTDAILYKGRGTE